MKDNKKSIDLSKFQKRLYPLSLEIDELVRKHGYDNVKEAIADEFGEELLEDEAFGVLPSALEISKPSKDVKTLSVSGAMYFVKDEHLLEYINLIEDVESFIKLKEVGTSSPEALKWRQAFYSLSDLKDFATGELFDRVQVYNNEIKELKGEN